MKDLLLGFSFHLRELNLMAFTLLVLRKSKCYWFIISLHLSNGSSIRSFKSFLFCLPERLSAFWLAVTRFHLRRSWVCSWALLVIALSAWLLALNLMFLVLRNYQSQSYCFSFDLHFSYSKYFCHQLILMLKSSFNQWLLMLISTW